MKPSLSVIISASVGKAKALFYCLSCLARQTWESFEVWVIDDGSSDCQSVVENFCAPFPLFYHWRGNDACQARSRNLGAKNASTEYLVFIDADILLNPKALGFYDQALKQTAGAIYGYFGTAKDFISSSYWFPHLEVQGVDYRFYFGPQGELYYHHSDILHYPQIYAHGGNFGLPRSSYFQVGGFDETYQGWGGEDIAFAHSLCQAGLALDFSLDIWGEHLAHPSRVRLTQPRPKLQAFPQAQPGLLFNPDQTKLYEIYRSHYMPQALANLKQKGKIPEAWMLAFEI